MYPIAHTPMKTHTSSTPFCTSPHPPALCIGNLAGLGAAPLVLDVPASPLNRAMQVRVAFSIVVQPENRVQVRVTWQEAHWLRGSSIYWLTLSPSHSDTPTHIHISPPQRQPTPQGARGAWLWGTALVFLAGATPMFAAGWRSAGAFCVAFSLLLLWASLITGWRAAHSVDIAARLHMQRALTQGAPVQDWAHYLNFR